MTYHSQTTPESDDVAHATVVELSALIDGALAKGQAAAASAHVTDCPDCRQELTRLRSARDAVASASFPVAPAGAGDRAVVAALFVTSLSLVAQAARDSGVAIEAQPAAGAVALPPEASAPQPDSSTAPALAASPVPGFVAGRIPVLATGAHSAGPSVDRRRTDRRAPVAGASGSGQELGQRRIRFVAAVAALVLVLGGIGAGVAALLSSSPHQASALDHHPTQTSAPSSPHSTTTVPVVNGGNAGPAAVALSLQLRLDTGPASCAKVSRHLENVHGVLVALNPRASSSAVSALPGSGPTATCATLGPAFATLSSADITHLSIQPVSGTPPSSANASGTPVDVVIDVKPTAFTSSATLGAAERSGSTTEVLAQGADLGTAVVTNGTVVTLAVSSPVAKFLRENLPVR
jgi:anti-sigma factor RsiW